MGLFDACEAEIGRAEAEGVTLNVPEFSSAMVDAIVEASLRAAAPGESKEQIQAANEVDADEGTSQRTRHRPRRWVPWVCAAAVSVVAAQGLWIVSSSPDDTSPTAGALPSALPLELGGTSRVLGGSPAVRVYGLGDAFFVELPFTAKVRPPIFAELSALDAAGKTTHLPFEPVVGEDNLRFYGDIAAALAPGPWTLRVRYGRPDSCSASASSGCEVLERGIDVVGP